LYSHVLAHKVDATLPLLRCGSMCLGKESFWGL